MKIYLAGVEAFADLMRKVNPPYVLASFLNLYKNSHSNLVKQFITDSKTFMLDSGAYTFMMDNSKAIDFGKYVERYARFIVNHDIKLYFEMDIDSVVGLKKVEEYRDYLESETNRPSIPVFHKERGKEYWYKMIKDYDYVALGGIAGQGEVLLSSYKYFKWFIKTAHDCNTKIHCLGFTGNKNVKKYPFDSVDSTTWLHGAKFGWLCKWNPITKELEKYVREGRLKLHWSETQRRNLKEYMKFVEYMDK